MSLIESLKYVGLEYDSIINAAIFTIGGKNWVISPSHSYYFIVRGNTPLEVAEKLYNHPVGGFIRVNGDCTRPKPEGFEVKYLCQETGKKVINADQEEQFDKIINGRDITDKQYWIDCKAKYIFRDDKSNCDAFIELYHIDSELGLYVFLEYLRNYYDSRKV